MNWCDAFQFKNEEKNEYRIINHKVGEKRKLKMGEQFPNRYSAVCTVHIVFYSIRV